MLRAGQRHALKDDVGTDSGDIHRQAVGSAQTQRPHLRAVNCGKPRQQAEAVGGTRSPATGRQRVLKRADEERVPRSNAVRSGLRPPWPQVAWSRGSKAMRPQCRDRRDKPRRRQGRRSAETAPGLSLRHPICIAERGLVDPLQVRSAIERQPRSDRADRRTCERAAEFTARRCGLRVIAASSEFRRMVKSPTPISSPRRPSPRNYPHRQRSWGSVRIQISLSILRTFLHVRLTPHVYADRQARSRLKLH